MVPENGFRMRSGGGSGIRTHDTVSRIHAFQACALSHSAIPPAINQHGNQHGKSDRQYSGGVPRYNPARMRCGAATESGRGRLSARTTSRLSDAETEERRPIFHGGYLLQCTGAEPIRTLFVISADRKEVKQEDVMGRGLLLWLLGIPIPIIILIWVLGGLHG